MTAVCIEWTLISIIKYNQLPVDNVVSSRIHRTFHLLVYSGDHFDFNDAQWTGPCLLRNLSLGSLGVVNVSSIDPNAERTDHKFLRGQAELKHIKVDFKTYSRTIMGSSLYGNFEMEATQIRIINHLENLCGED